MLSPLSALLHERDRWFLWVPVGIGVGVVGYFALADEPSRLWLLAAPLLALAAWLVRRRGWALVVATALLTVALGFNAAQVETWLYNAPMLNRMEGPTAVTGRLMLAEAMPDGARLTLRDVTINHVPPEKTPERVRIKVKVPLNELPEPGARINLWAEVGPFSEAVMPGAYDFRRQAFFQRYGGGGWSYGELRVEDPTPPAGLGDRFSLMFERARRALGEHATARLEGDSAAMTAALLNGQQTGIARDVMQAMRASGLSHLLSISGIHVSMIGILVYVPLRALLALIPWFALRFPIKKIAALTAIGGTMLYMLLVGPQTPTLRSTLMTSLVMFAIIVDRRALSMRLVALTAAAVMLIAPDGVMGASFQMSFAAVLGMVAAFEKPLDAALRESDLHGWVRRAWHHAAAIILTSLVATAATTPFTLYHFQSFSFYGVLANMIAIPLTSFWVMPCLLLTYLTAPFGWDAPFLTAAGWGVDAIIALARQVAAWPYAVIASPAMPEAAFLAMVLGGLWLCLWRRGWRYLGLVPMVGGLLYPLYASMPDVMVDAKAKTWAVRLEDGRYAVPDLDHEKFTLAQWRQRLGNPEFVEVGEDSLPPLRCDPLGCVYAQNGERIALPRLPAALLDDCREASLVITPLRLKHCPAPLLIDGHALREHGSYALSFTAKGLQVERVRERRGTRPWAEGWVAED